MEADEYYSDRYSEVCCTGAVGYVSQVIHRALETVGIGPLRKKLEQRTDLLKVLEVGAGGGQHSIYVKHMYDEM